jgi:hypothetical protein
MTDRRIDMAKKGMPIGGGYTVNYGHAGDYLARRIARDRPDILQAMKEGQYRSVRQAAIAAGIMRIPADEDKALTRLYEAWCKAGLEDRRLFLVLMADEIEAASDGHYLNSSPTRRGPHPFVPNEATEIPELEALIHAGAAVSRIAQHVGVSYRTICRWRRGQSQPSPAKRQVLVKMADQTAIGMRSTPGEEEDEHAEI